MLTIENSNDYFRKMSTPLVQDLVQVLVLALLAVVLAACLLPQAQGAAAPPEAALQQLMQFQLNLAHMGNRKYQPVPSTAGSQDVASTRVRIESEWPHAEIEDIEEKDTRVFVAPSRDYTKHPAWPKKVEISQFPYKLLTPSPGPGPLHPAG